MKAQAIQYSLKFQKSSLAMCTLWMFAIAIGVLATESPVWADELALSQKDEGVITIAEPWEEGPRIRPLLGDLDGDDLTSLDDLVKLGKAWSGNTARQRYGVTREKLLAEIRQNWRKSVPPTIGSVSRRGAFTPFVAASRFRTARYIGGSKSGLWDEEYVKSMQELADEKNLVPDQFEQVGFGVNLRDDQPLPVLSGNQLFRSPSELPNDQRRQYFPNQVFNRLNGGFNEDPNQSPVRYNLPIDVARDRVTYISSYSEALDAYGVDVNVSASYGLYSGDFSLSVNSSNFSEDKQHTIVARVTRSFGWEFASDIVTSEGQDGLLLPQFIADLNEARKPGTDFDLVQKYGTHYVFAQHMAAELFIEFNFSTRTSVSRDSVSTALNFSANAGTVEGSAAFNSITQDVQGSSRGSVRVEVIGGPLEITFERERRTITSFLSSEIQNGATSERVGLIVAAWDAELLAQVNRGDVVGAPIDYLYRPITDFLNVPTNPFSVQRSLRDWYIRFVDTKEQLDRRNRYITRGDEKFTRAFGFLELAAPIGPGNTYRNFATPLEYTVAVRQETEDLYLDLIDIGRELYQSQEDDNFSTSQIFLASIRENLIPEFELPLPRLRVVGVENSRFERGLGQVAPDAMLTCRIEHPLRPADCPSGAGVYIGVPIGAAAGLPDFYQGCANTGVRMTVTLDTYAFLAQGENPRYIVLHFLKPVAGLGNPTLHPPYMSGGRNQGRRFGPVTDEQNRWVLDYLVGSRGCTDNPAWAWGEWDAWVANGYPGLTFYLFDTETRTIIDYICGENGRCSPVEIDALFQSVAQGK